MLRHYLPEFLNKRLFGDRSKFSDRFDEQDQDWLKWQNFLETFYFETQRKGIGFIVNNWGYRILKNLDFTNKNVLEIGPGNMPHLSFLKGTPKLFNIADVDKILLNHAADVLKKSKISYKCHLINNIEDINVKDNSLDVILTFYSLEHLFDLENKITFLKNKLKKNGLIVGAVPNEGGLMWGLGRLLTARRFVYKNTTINYDKIICWSHPNFCDDIFAKLKKKKFLYLKKNCYPFGRFMPFDLNLVTSFVLKKIDVN